MDYYLVDLLRESFPICNSSSGSPQEDSFEASDIDQCRDEEEDQINAGPRLGLQFVAETGVARPKGSLRELIRSQARRKRPNRRQKAASKRSSTILRASNKWDQQNEASISTDPYSSGPVIWRDATPHPDRGPASNAFDPFYTLPIDENGNSHFLLSQFHAIFNPEYHAFSCAIRKEDVISFAITDSALLHATLAHSALSLCNIARTKSSPDMAYHAGQAIRLVNKRIANSPQEAVSDATMFTVGCLTHFEVRSLSIESIKIHLDGLEALVKARGGIQTLVDNPLTMRFIYWTDAVGSIAMNTKPRFELSALPAIQNPADWEPYSHLALRYSTKLCNLTGLPDLSQETVEVYWGLRNLTATKDLITASQLPAITRVEFHSYTGRLVGRLINIVQHEIPDLPNQNALIFRLFGNAGLAHVVMFLRDNPVGHPFSELLSTRIRASLEMIDIPTFQLRYPEMMLWILIMGGLGAIGTDNQWWFTKLVAEMCHTTGIARTTEIPFFLTEFFWTDLYLYPTYTEFWNDVTENVEGGNAVARVVDELDLASSESPPNLAG